MDNIFIFGMKENEVEDLKKRGYNAFDYYNANAELKQVRLKILFFLLRKNAKRNELFFSIRSLTRLPPDSLALTTPMNSVTFTTTLCITIVSSAWLILMITLRPRNESMKLTKYP